MIQYYILIRHGKAEKNLNNIHGGSGSILMQEGKEEIIQIAEKIKNAQLDLNSIGYVEKTQCYQFAIILSSILKIPIKIIKDLKPINLGILDGLSEKEALERYPKEANLMNRWRKREIEIVDLIIPGMSNINEFYRQGLYFLDNLKSNKSSIIIATRSNLVQLANIMFGHTIKKGGDYREIEWVNAGILAFSFDGTNFKIFNDLTNLNIDGNIKTN